MNSESIRVLLLENNPGDTRWVQEVLQAGNGDSRLPASRLTHVERLGEGLSRLSETPFDVILCGLSLPDSPGVETVRRLHQAAPDTPLIVMLGTADDALGLQAIREGAHDYLHKGRADDTLARVIRYAVERRQAAETVRESEKRFRALIENSTDSIVLADAQGVIRYVSPATTRNLGYPVEAFVGRNGFELIHPDDIAAVRADFDRILGQPNASAHTLLRLRHHNGTWRWIEATTTNLLTEPGVEAIVSNFRDITERRRAEENIRAQAMLVESISDAVISTDSNFVIRSWNKAAERLHGYTAEEAIGRSTREVLSGEYEGLTREEARAQLLATGHWEGELVAHRKDGARVNVFVSTTLLRDAQGAILGMLAINRDITERKRAEAALHDSAQQFRHLFDASPDAILLIDPYDPLVVWPIVDCNEVACQMNGYARDELIGQPLDLINVKKSTLQEFAASLEQLHREGVVRGLQAFHRHKDGHEFPVEYSTSLITVAGRPLILGIDRDITGRRRAEEALRVSEERFRFIAQATNDAIWDWDLANDTIWWSDSFLTIFGYRDEEIEAGSQSWLSRIHPDDRERVFSGVKEVIESGRRTWSDEYRFRRGDGTHAHVIDRGYVVHDQQGNAIRMLGSLMDITERKTAEEALRASEARLSDALHIAQLAYWERDIANDLFIFNDQFYALLHTSAEREGGYTMPAARYVKRFVHPDDLPMVRAAMQKTLETPDPNYSHQIDHRILYADGEIGYITVRLRVEKDAQGRTIKTNGANQDITERKQRERELEAIAIMSSALRTASTRSEMLPIILDQVMDWLNAESAGIVMPDPTTGENIHELARGKHADWTGMRRPPGQGASAHVIATGLPYLISSPHDDPVIHDPSRLGENEFIGWVPLIAQGAAIGAMWVSRQSKITKSELRVLIAISDIAATAIRRVALHEETRKRADELAAVNRLGRALAETLDLPHIYEQCREAIFSLLPDTDALFISAYSSDTRSIQPLYGYRDGQPLPLDAPTPAPIQNDPQGECIRNRRPVTVNGVGPAAESQPAQVPTARLPSALYAPMVVKGVVTGVIQVQSDRSHHFGDTDASLLAFVANTAAIAIENARLFAETRKQLERLQALRTIDSAVTASLDLRVTLSILLEQVTTQLEADAASILILHPPTHTLKYSAGRGFRTQTIERTQLRVGEDFAGRAALERRPISIHNLYEVGVSFKRSALLNEEGFVAYYAVPLITKGSVKGVLEIYHRAPLAIDFEWTGFADTLAGQAAIAIENVSLFNELQRSNTELILAYDTTLEGWTRALDLRDRAIEGHTQRVTEMSVRLGRAMGLDETQLLHLRRGALLHDIGHFGVPDSILDKAGPLTEEEWAVVRKHPEYALNLLRPITFLRQAVDIPYCHHERWDGSGYPRGLKATQIPIAARIYAVVDVWEALQADRPYRPAWLPDQVRIYLSEQSGRLFDPQVVEKFLELFYP